VLPSRKVGLSPTCQTEAKEVDQLSGVLRALLAERESLNKQLEDINFENYTMKTTIHVLRKETQEARSLAEKLEAKLDEADQAAPSTPRNLILTLLDGDGYIFHSDLLKKGEAGGREAAVAIPSILATKPLIIASDASP